jgi:hypothetical protein
MKIQQLLLASAAVFALAGSANATTMITSTFSPYAAAPLPAGEAVVVDFDNANANGYTYTTTGATGIFDGSKGLVSGVAAPPATSATTADQTLFEAVQTNGALDLKTPTLSALSVYVGSIDNYNEITFEGPHGFTQSFSGSMLQLPANGDQSQGDTNGRVDFNFNGQAINEVLFQSSANSFEFDNIAAAAAVPEPASWAIMLVGFGGLGAAMRSRRKQAVAA